MYRNEKPGILNELKRCGFFVTKCVDVVSLSFAETVIPMDRAEKLEEVRIRISYNLPHGLFLSHRVPLKYAPTYYDPVAGRLYQSPLEYPYLNKKENPIIITSYDTVQPMLNGCNDLTGKGIKVAVIDTGFTKINRLYQNRRPVSVSLLPEPPIDIMGHGTHVCNMLSASQAVSPYGSVIGAAPDSELIAIKVLNPLCIGRTIDIIHGIGKAHEMGAHVINMSLGSIMQGDAFSDPICQAVDDVVFNGNRIVVAAVGNSAEDWSIRSPAAALGAISVGALSFTDDGEPSWFSSKGPQNTWYRDHQKQFDQHLGTYGIDMLKPDCMAFGGGRGSKETLPDEVINNGSVGYGEILYDGKLDSWGQFHGTSQAAPLVSGIIARALEKEPNLTTAEIKRRLMNTAGTEKSPVYGYGMMSLGRIIQGS